MLDDRETQSGTARRARPVGAEESLEQPRHIFFGDAGTVVGDLEHDPIVVAPERDSAIRALACVPDRVHHEVLGDKAQHPRTQRNVKAVVLDPKLEHDACQLGPLGELGHELAQDRRGLGVAKRDDLALLFELAQEEDVVHELPHLRDLAVGLPQERLQVGAGQLGRLQQREQPRERSAQLMGNSSREAGAELVVLGARGH